MEYSKNHIVCALFLTGILCACGSGASSLSDQKASLTAAAMTAVQPTPINVASPTTALIPISQESPIFSPTPQLSPNPTFALTGKTPRCNDSLFLSDVTIPDGTIFKPRENFSKTWKFTNTGACSWTTAYKIVFSYGYAMSGTDTKLPKSVVPGGEVDVTVDMTSPKTNGWYGGWWRLTSEAGDPFGDFVYVSILVSDGQETSTPGS